MPGKKRSFFSGLIDAAKKTLDDLEQPLNDAENTVRESFRKGAEWCTKQMRYRLLLKDNTGPADIWMALILATSEPDNYTVTITYTDKDGVTQVRSGAIRFEGDDETVAVTSSLPNGSTMVTPIDVEAISRVRIRETATAAEKAAGEGDGE